MGTQWSGRSRLIVVVLMFGVWSLKLPLIALCLPLCRDVPFATEHQEPLGFGLGPGVFIHRSSSNKPTHPRGNKILALDGNFAHSVGDASLK